MARARQPASLRDLAVPAQALDSVCPGAGHREAGV